MFDFRFNCSVCGCKCSDTRFPKAPDELTLALSPWLTLCTQHEKEFFASKRLEGHVYESPVIENPVIVHGAVDKSRRFPEFEKQTAAELVQEVSELIEENGDDFFDPQGV